MKKPIEEFRGKLYVFVETSPEEELPSAAGDPDDVFSRRSTGDMLWYHVGWAISSNPKGTYCARTSTAKLRSFETFSACMNFARKKRQERPHERFYPVYEIEGRKSIVTSLEQILGFDGDAARAEQFTPAGERETRAAAMLSDKFGKIVATNALVLLRTLDRDGEAAARARYSNATYARLWQVLREAALVGDMKAAQPG